MLIYPQQNAACNLQIFIFFSSRRKMEGWLAKLLMCLLIMFHRVFLPPSEARHLCRHDQTLALLQMKHSLAIDKSVSTECDSSDGAQEKKLLPYPKTDSWNATSDCCTWEGVTCDERTGDVVILDLSCSQLRGRFNPNSTLHRLSRLQRLNLAHNDFSPSPIPGNIGLFPSLIYLNLSNAGFSGRVPCEISHLSKLASLDLSGNFEGLELEPHCFKQLLKNLTSLRELDLSNVQTASVIQINVSRTLEIISLGDTGLVGEFPDYIFDLPKLKKLVLASNSDLRGRLPRRVWNSRRTLRELDLSSSSFSGDLPDSIGHLQSLVHLDLSSCKFSGSIPESLGNLTQIKNLILFSNNLSGRVPLSLRNLDQLIRLDISTNILTGEIPDVFGEFRGLKDLSMADNLFTGKFPISVTNLTQIESLDLSNVSMSGPIPATPGALPALVLLFLQENQLTGEIPFWVYDHLPSLKYLDMRPNQLSGQIKAFNSKVLEYIDLSDNKLEGHVPSSISKLVNLTTLDLSSNNLSGDLDVSTFSNLKSLKRLGLSFNAISLSSSIGNEDITLPGSLDTLWLSSCNIRELDFLRETKRLGKLDFSRNKIQELPAWALSSWGSSLYYLNLSFNSLTGVNEIFTHFENLVYLDLRSNLLQGSLQVPSPTTQIFYASNNNLTGELPVSICNLTSLAVLDLSNNFLNGAIPKCVATMSESLSVLDMHGNNFRGTIPTDFGKGNPLRTLNLHGNHMEGSVPRSILNCRQLEVLDLGDNDLNGTFPMWLGNLPMLQVLSLRSNRLHGPITNTPSHHTTYGTFPELRIIDLSYNGFTGTLPTELFINFKAMTGTYNMDSSLKYIGETFYQDSLTVMIKGQDIKLVRILSIFTTVLSSNKFEGEIPDSVGTLTTLRGLNLSHNSIAGHIPSSFRGLSVLESLDLSSNQLVGEIPEELVGLTFLSVLNLSQNHLEGIIPQGNQFNTFQNDSYLGNEGLCGTPLSKRCGNPAEKPHTPFETEEEEEEDSEFMNGFGWRSVVIGYGVAIVPGLLMGHLIFFPNGTPQWLKRWSKQP